MLSHYQQQVILKQFPKKIELCHGKILHNKVYNIDYFRLIPKGKKYFIWFKKHRDKVFCYFLEKVPNRNQIVQISTFQTCFDATLTEGLIGTICYGTIFTMNKIRFCSIEDILYLKSEKVYNKTWNIKIQLMEHLMTHIKQVIYTKNGVVLGIPIMTTNKYDIDKIIPYVPYNLYSLEHLSSHRRTILIKKLNNYSMVQKKAVFEIKAEVKSDIYTLYCQEQEYNMAYIPDYKTSVMMNGYYRKIKENENLDYLEESDDEEEFENISLDKFVDLTKTYKFECVYNNKFKMWTPCKKVDDSEQLVKFKEVKYLM